MGTRKFGRHAAGFALLFLVTLAAYFPILHGGFLWDDNAHVTPLRLRPFDGLRQIWFQPGLTQQYYPLLYSAFWLENRIWGHSTPGYHLLNIALHALAAYLLVLIVRRLGLPGAWLSGTIFALHPICTEAVAWISEQKSTLSGVFYLASALVYLDFDESRGRQQYAIAFALFVLALLSKTVTATLPAALLVVLWWKRGGIGWKRDVRPLIPWFATGAAGGLVTAGLEQSMTNRQAADYALSIAQRFLLAGRASWFYLGKVFWPARLTFIYPRWTLDPSDWRQYLYPLGAIAAGLLLYLFARRNRAPLAALLFFVGTLFPAIGFLNVYPFRYSFVADHFQYLASIGVIVPVSAALALLSRRFLARPWMQMACVAAVAVFLGSVTWRESHRFQNSEILYRETLEQNPACWLCRNNLGQLMLSEGLYPEATAEFGAALRLRPNFVEAQDNLGLVYLRENRREDALAAFNAALRIDPSFDGAHEDIAVTLLDMPGREREAIAQLQMALRMNPYNANAHYNLAVALIRISGDRSEVLHQLEETIRLDPARDDARNLAARLSLLE